MIISLLAGETKHFQIAGSKFVLISGLAELHVKLNAGGATKTYKMLAGRTVNFDPEYFHSIEITNGATPQQIEFEVFEKEVEDNRIAGTISAEEVPATVADDVPDQVLGAGGNATIPLDTGRKKLVVYALHTNTDFIRVSPNVAGAARGYPLGPTAFVSYGGTYAVTLHNPSGVDQGFGYYWEDL